MDNGDDSYIFTPFTLANPAIIGYNSTKHKAQSTKHKAQSTKHKAQSDNRSLISFSEEVVSSSSSLFALARGAAFPKDSDSKNLYERGGGFFAVSADVSRCRRF
jgi:hypothetical protein